VLFIFMLSCSIQLIPFYELSSQSIRKTGLSYEEAITWSFAWKDFIQFFLPNPYGYLQSDAKYWANQSWLKTVYLGIAPFILSIFYFISKDRKKWLFIGLIIISFIFALGGNTPIYKILFYVPPFNSVRYPVKFLFVFFFIIAITSGLGFDRLKQGIEAMDGKTRKVIKAVFYVGFIFALAWGYVNIFNQDVRGFFERHNIKPDAFNDIDFNIHNIKRFFLFSFFFCVIVLVSLRIKYKRVAFFGLIFILTADLFLANYGYYQLASWKDYMKRHAFEEVIRNKNTERYIVTPFTREKFKLYPEDKMALSPAYACISGLYTEGGMEVLRIVDYEIFTSMLYATNTIEEAKRFFDISGIAYVISAKEINDGDFELLDTMKVEIIRPKKDEKDGFVKKSEEETIRLYRYRRSPGRFLLYHHAIFVKDITTAIKKMEDKAVDLRSSLIIIDPKRDLIGASKNISLPLEKDGRHQGSVKILTYKPDRIELKCESIGDSYLYISDTFYTGWKAYIDGKKTDIYKANIAFRAIYVPEGSHTVIFKYMPLSFFVGIIFTCLGIFLLFYLIKNSDD
ncbi:MAG TPA: YfhO family protein, partial [Syntrophorhabdaceae bacterium]|nr:YfhO family protein [Syntrophorhabdaceae bacterium]